MVNELLDRFQDQILNEDVQEYLVAASPTGQVRVILEGSTHTLDHNPQRLNVIIEYHTKKILDLFYG